MREYKLYKGVWIPINENKSQCLSPSQLKKLLNQGGWAVRNVYNFDTSKKTSFWYVIKDSFGGMEELSVSARRDVRKSLRTYDVFIITNEELLNIGYPIYSSAQESYKIKCSVITPQEYELMVKNYGVETNKEFWGVRHKVSGEFVALAINTIKDDSCEYNVLKCKPQALKDGTQPYYGLIYEMNRHYLEERRFKYVNDGARSITNHSNIQSFLIKKFKFRQAYSDIQVAYKWWLKILINLLYPFRKVIPFRSVRAFLNMEAMVRGKM